MAIYPFKCKNCDIAWEIEKPMAKAPTKSKCKSCGKYVEQDMESKNSAFTGGGTDQEKERRLRKDKEFGKKSFEYLIDTTKKRLEEGGPKYKDYKLTKEGMNTALETKALRKRDSKEAEIVKRNFEKNPNHKK